MTDSSFTFADPKLRKVLLEQLYIRCQFTPAFPLSAEVHTQKEHFSMRVVGGVVNDEKIYLCTFGVSVVFGHDFGVEVFETKLSGWDVCDNQDSFDQWLGEKLNAGWLTEFRTAAAFRGAMLLDGVWARRREISRDHPALSLYYGVVAASIRTHRQNIDVAQRSLSASGSHRTESFLLGVLQRRFAGFVYQARKTQTEQLFGTPAGQPAV